MADQKEDAMDVSFVDETPQVAADYGEEPGDNRLEDSFELPASYAGVPPSSSGDRTTSQDALPPPEPLLGPVAVNNVDTFRDNYSSSATPVNLNNVSAHDHNSSPSGPATLWSPAECSTALAFGSAYPAIAEPDVLHAISPLDGLPSRQEDRPFEGSEHGSMHVSGSNGYQVSPGQTFSIGGLQIYTDRIPMPFEDSQQARLFKHYIDALSSLLDITDIQKHFTIDVPERALRCPVLLNAILAFSARHLSRTTGFDSQAADHYHEECVSLLIPTLDHKDIVMDETVFAAAVILRAFEETNGTSSFPLLFEKALLNVTRRVQNGCRSRAASHWHLCIC
ncbi:hypothetical protein LTR20_004605 [Exophiala xenobiotica]|nr:hypothetical protein LTR90_004617 [Exophiala xenobiotica]KAK5463899.1 hypothetical protein LTR20_004605 [Exophiala xenobiotica]KAK5497661.1 hypothetical protein LTR26_001061 [Exophiala xenobiotica]KAK5503460.1 hypothetical protein LTR83_001385 [Exophiala xenobiotica]KAK5515949.1 hypothetical protein LTR21_003635 [Exophiala xenobiotica]